MIETYKPGTHELGFRQRLLADRETMSYNDAWGGTIPFPEEVWKKWADTWLGSPEYLRWYRYLYDTDLRCFVGEIAWRFDERRKIHLGSVIILAEFRNRGFGTAGIRLLCKTAKEHGIPAMYDDISVENPSYHLFLKNGFEITDRSVGTILVRKEL